jgi:hypothetical protein
MSPRDNVCAHVFMHRSLFCVFHRQQIGSLCMSLQGNAVLSVDDLHDACFKREKGQIRLWAVSQPPTLEEILENERIRDEYEKCAQALAACNPSNFPEPSRERKLVFPLIERIVMIGAPAEAAVAKGSLDASMQMLDQTQ